MTLKSKANSPEFDAGYEAIFGANKPIERGSWVQDSETGEFIPKSELGRHDPDAPAVHGGIEAFKSPIDGTMIDDRAKLRAHNQRHGVTNISDYGDNDGKAYFERKASERQRTIEGQTREAKQERVETIKRAMSQHGMSY